VVGEAGFELLVLAHIVDGWKNCFSYVFCLGSIGTIERVSKNA
jgi:hypothetical protein